MIAASWPKNMTFRDGRYKASLMSEYVKSVSGHDLQKTVERIPLSDFPLTSASFSVDEEGGMTVIVQRSKVAARGLIKSSTDLLEARRAFRIVQYIYGAHRFVNECMDAFVQSSPHE
jgi:hypothetical protein